MKCAMCKRKVRDSFADKLKHMMQFHPDRLVQNAAVKLPSISRSIGEQLGEILSNALKGETK